MRSSRPAQPFTSGFVVIKPENLPNGTNQLVPAISLVAAVRSRLSPDLSYRQMRDLIHEAARQQLECFFLLDCQYAQLRAISYKYFTTHRFELVLQTDDGRRYIAAWELRIEPRSPFYGDSSRFFSRFPMRTQVPLGKARTLAQLGPKIVVLRVHM